MADRKTSRYRIVDPQKRSRPVPKAAAYLAVAEDWRVRYGLTKLQAVRMVANRLERVDG